nr:14144_t:CDS:2 [Entrophospora candida]
MYYIERNYVYNKKNINGVKFKNIKYRWINTRSGIFGNSLAWISTNNVDLLTWWKGNFGAVTPELTKVAPKISKVTNVGEDIDDSNDDGNVVDNVDNSDIDSDDENELSVNI